MNQFFAKNLDRRGRLIRGIGGLLSIGAAVWIHDGWPRAALVLGAVGLFAIYQAIRGWCLLRACGAKMPF